MQYTINIPEHLIPALQATIDTLKPRSIPPEEFLGNICTSWITERYRSQLVDEIASQPTEKLTEVREILKEPVETIIEAKLQAQAIRAEQVVAVEVSGPQEPIISQ